MDATDMHSQLVEAGWRVGPDGRWPAEVAGSVASWGPAVSGHGRAAVTPR